MSVQFLSPFNYFIYPAFFLVGILAGLFLFWRACRHELVDSEEAFDLIVVGLAGAIFFSRLADLVFHNSPASWSIDRFVFFNKFGSFDFYGALFGIIFALILFLKSKKTNLWFVLDLIAAPLVFGQALISLGSFLVERNIVKDYLSLYYFIGYFLIFLVLKRLAARKRHFGFFISFYLVSISLLDMLVFKFKTQVVYLGKAPYELLAPAVILTLAAINWHYLAKRSWREEFKKVLGFILLSVFRMKRMLLSSDEAGKFSKSLILFPYYLIRAMGAILLVMGKEIKLGVFEFLYVIGFKKFSRR